MLVWAPSGSTCRVSTCSRSALYHLRLCSSLLSTSLTHHSRTHDSIRALSGGICAHDLASSRVQVMLREPLVYPREWHLSHTSTADGHPERQRRYIMYARAKGLRDSGLEGETVCGICCRLGYVGRRRLAVCAQTVALGCFYPFRFALFFHYYSGGSF